MTTYLRAMLAVVLTLAVTKPASADSFWERRLTGYINAADGTQLKYSAILPPGSGPFPAILNYSGYDPGVIGGPAYARGETMMSVELDRTLLEHGYAVVGVNIRGSGCSAGRSDFLAPTFGTDGRDAIAFIAAQPWSDGNVGMANYSFPGITQLATAAERPPALRAIAPGMVVADLRLDSWAPGGVPQTGFAIGNSNAPSPLMQRHREAALADGDQGCLERLDTNRAQPSLAQQLFQHPVRDAWHDARRLSLRTGRINVPVLSVEAFQDEQTGPRGDYYQDTLDPRRLWLVQTNGHHGLYMARRFWADHLIPFFDRFVKGKANDFDHRPHVTVWEGTRSTETDRIGKSLAAVPGRVISYPDYPVQVTPLRLYLNTDGQLVGDKPSDERQIGFAYPVPGPAVGTRALGDKWGPQPADWRTASLAYTSTPLSDPLALYGSASLDLWVDVTMGDADIQATLTELLPSGEEIYIQRGWLRLSGRALDEARSTPLRPVIHDRIDMAQPVKVDTPVLARIEINKFFHRFGKESRVRIWIDPPSPTGDNIFVHYSVPGKVRIWSGADHASSLVVGRISDLTPPLAARCTLSFLSQPCRPDPLADR